MTVPESSEIRASLSGPRGAGNGADELIDGLYPLPTRGMPGRSRRFAEGHGGQMGFMAAELTPYPDGPYLLRGEFELRGPDGERIDPRRKTVALCRCGASRRKPF